MDKEQMKTVKTYLAVAAGVFAIGAAVAIALEWLKPGSTPLKKLRGYTPCRFRFEELEEELEVEGDD